MDFIKVGAACPKTKVADIAYNIENICTCIKDARKQNIKINPACPFAKKVFEKGLYADIELK